MRFQPRSLLIGLLAALIPATQAERLLQSTSLNPCQSNNSFSATLFDVVFTPSNNSLAIDMVGVSSITGNVTIELVVIAYGLTAYKTTLNPCELNLDGLCPMNEGQINLNSNIDVPDSALADIPGKSEQHTVKVALAQEKSGAHLADSLLNRHYIHCAGSRCCGTGLF